MVRVTLSAAVIGLCPAVTFAQTDGVRYDTVTTTIGQATPSVLLPASTTAKQFGKVVATWNEIVAVSSTDLVMDYDSSGTVGTRGRISVFGSDYLRIYKDSGVEFTSPKVNDGFGSSLALWEGTMLVGAPNDNSDDENVGKAYVYFGTNFGSVQTLSADHGEAGDYFGYSVAIVHGKSYYGDGMAVVGAYGHDHDKESTVGQGCVFVYTRDSTYWWNLVGKLEPQDFEHKNHGGFGYSLSAYGNTVAVGTYSAEKVFVFELMGHLHECPHGHEGEGEQDLPEDCLDERRNLRALQGPPEDEKKWYTEWQYDHILTVGIEEEHKPEGDVTAESFGQSVALYNASGILTLAVGAPANQGTVYIMSIMDRSDVQENWYPDNYDHHEEDKQREEWAHEQEREEHEAEKDNKRSLQGQEKGEEDKNRFRTWNPQTSFFCGDKMGNFWVLEATFAGLNLYEHMGHSLDITDSALFIGSNPSTYQDGRAVYYQRTFGTTAIEENPLVSGPLFNTVWVYVSALADSLGMEGDHFGYSVAYNGNVAVVGAIMNDIQSDGTFGQGVAYVYDRITMVPVVLVAPTPSPVAAIEAEEVFLDRATDTNTLFGMEVMSFSAVVGLILVLGCGYALYRITGGTASPRQLLCGFSSSKSPPSGKQVRLASMDDSGFSSTSTSGRFKSRKTTEYAGLDTSDTSSHVSLNSRPEVSSGSGAGAGAGAGRSSIGNSYSNKPPVSRPPTSPAPKRTPASTPASTPPPQAGTSDIESSNPYLLHRSTLSAGAQRKFTPKS